MKKLLIALVVILFFNKATAQAPFDINVSQAPTDSEIVTKYFIKNSKRLNRLGINTFSSTITTKIDSMSNEVYADFDIKLAKKNLQHQLDTIATAALFNQYSGGIVMGSEATNLFPTINGSIVNYRLNVWTKIESDGTIKRYKIPLSIISKVSGTAADNSNTINDATSFFGAPLTFRLSPSKTFYFTENKLVIGMINDMRLISIVDTSITATNKVQTGFGYYGAIGASYFGTGEVDDDVAHFTHTGAWSFSSLLYWFKSGGQFNKAILGNYQSKNWLMGVEMMLRFNTANVAHKKFNLFLAANYGLTEGAANYNNWQFRLGIGN